MIPSARVGIISQARMTSTRLPGKILKLVNQHALLHYHLERLKSSGFPVFVATTTNKTDEPIVEFCTQSHIDYSRGSEENVLSRFYACAQKFKLEIIVRVTSDCPLIDGALIHKAVNEYLQFADSSCYYSNCIERTFPRGFDFEIFSFEMLESAYRNAKSDSEIEHVTPYFYRNLENKFHIRNFKNELDASKFRITVDTPEDFELVKKLIEEFDCASKNAAQICDVLFAHPELILLNQHIEQKKT
jgi:spore coat polysaccharide biosynthesis protein SpsF